MSSRRVVVVVANETKMAEIELGAAASDMERGKDRSVEGLGYGRATFMLGGGTMVRSIDRLIDGSTRWFESRDAMLPRSMT